MDENDIRILCEDLTNAFQALVQTHTTTIGRLLEEFNGNQMLLRLESEAYEQERIQVEKDAEAASQTSTGIMTEEAAQEPKDKEETRLPPEMAWVEEKTTEHEAFTPTSTRETRDQQLDVSVELQNNELSSEELPLAPHINLSPLQGQIQWLKRQPISKPGYCNN